MHSLAESPKTLEQPGIKGHDIRGGSDGKTHQRGASFIIKGRICIG